MPTRLTVIISQSASRESRAADAEESLLAELMMASGLDATLIGPLENIAPNSTDFLCLNGFNHSLALVSWLDAEKVAHECQRLQLAGQVVAFGQPAAKTETGKRIYHFSMRQPTSQILNQLLDLKRDRSVQTVGILLPGSGVASRPAATPVADDPPQTISSPPPKVPEKLAPTKYQNTDASSDSEADAAWSHLDQLVDDFDALDL